MSGSRGRDIVLPSCTAGGVRKWAARYDGVAHEDDYATGMVVNGSGDAYAVGRQADAGGGVDALIQDIKP